MLRSALEVESGDAEGEGGSISSCSLSVSHQRRLGVKSAVEIFEEAAFCLLALICTVRAADLNLLDLDR